MAPLQTLIVGAGIVGNVLVFQLSKLGHVATIVEHFSTLRTTGLLVDLRDHGIEVMKLSGTRPNLLNQIGTRTRLTSS